MPNWIHATCGADCPQNLKCPRFPTLRDRIDLARYCFDEYGEGEGTSELLDFFRDVYALARSSGKTIESLQHAIAETERQLAAAGFTEKPEKT